MKDENEDKPANDVGYCKPPAEHQYPKGVSGHPGRKLGSKNKPKLPPGLTEAEKVTWEEAMRPVATKAGDMEAHRAVSRSQLATAGKGGTNAQKAYLARFDRLAEKAHAAQEALLAHYEEYVRYCEDLLERSDQDKRGRLEPLMLPHPYDLEVDWDKREVRVYGPSTSLERRIWNKMLAEVDYIRSCAVQARLDLERDPTNLDLQVYYIITFGGFNDLRGHLPERYRPAPLPRWEKQGTVHFWFDDGPVEAAA